MSVPPVVAPAALAVQPSRGRRAASLAWSVFLAVACGMLVMSAGGTYGVGEVRLPEPWGSIGFFATLPMLGVSTLLVWRHRYPVVVSVIAIVCTAVFPTSSLPVLVALAAAVAARDGRTRWLLVAGTWFATAVTLWWNTAAPQSALATLAGGPPIGSPGRTLLAWFVPLIAALFVLPFAAFGMSRVLRRERDRAAADVAAATRNVTVLRREVELEHHRRELARELHDGLAAKLSAVSLHAGAFELSVEGTDEQAAKTAGLVREAAQHALDDLRGVVHGLRNPAEPRRTQGLGDLPALIDEATAGGADVRAQVFVTDAGGCSPESAHTVYRVVQESISNARRHAPGAVIRIDLRGDPDTGLTLKMHNPLTPHVKPTSTGGGFGLNGMGERVALAGGSFQAGQTPEGDFAVIAWVPGTRP